MPRPEGKPFAIPRPMVWEAWRRVKANRGAPGVDGQAIEEFEADLADKVFSPNSPIGVGWDVRRAPAWLGDVWAGRR